MLEHCGCTPAKCNKTPKGKMCPKHGMSDCSMKEEKDPKGPVKPYKSPEEIAKKHKVSLDAIIKQVKMGTKVEGEHTTSKSGARITALQHVEELPDYYTRLKKAEQVKEGNLHQWFKGSKSKDGKPGWVNVVTGGTCASDEPGEGTPKCVSSSKRASMSKSERLSASRRKKSADPGQQSKSGAAKPTYVSTDVKEGWSDKYKRSIDCDNPKGFSQRAHCQGKKKMQEQSFTIDVVGHKSAQKQQKIRNLATGTTNSNEKAAAQRKLSGPSLPLADEYVVEGDDKKGKGSGKKDACYHKVKARYDVWPSAYASGALVKCRQAGAKNWGNKSEEFFPEDHKEVASGKKKDEEGYMARAELDTIERAIKNLRKVVKKGDTQLPAWVQSKITKAADYIDTASDYLQSDEEVSEACWTGYKQVGMKKKGNKTVPNCVKEQNYVMPSASQTGAYSGGVKGKAYKVGDTIPASETKPKAKPSRFSVDKTGLEGPKNPLGENIDKIQQYGRTYTIILTWHGSTYKLQMFFSGSSAPSRKEVEDAIHKVYPGGTLNAYMPSRIDPTKPTLLAAEEFEIEEGMDMKAFKQQRSRQKQKEKRAADKIAPNRRAGIHNPEKAPEREARRNAAGGETGYGGPLRAKKVRKAKALGELGENFAEQALAIVLDPDKEKRRKNYLLNIGVIGEDWQSVNRKDKTDGLSPAAVKAYRRENPGSKLQTAVTEKKPTGKRAERRKSFCRRMKGMKSKLTSAQTANDPDSRINKALRRWNCN